MTIPVSIRDRRRRACHPNAFWFWEPRAGPAAKWSARGWTVLADAMRGQDAVISALGQGLKLRSENLITRSTPLILEAMERAGVRRLIVTSAYGVGITWRDVPPLPRILVRVFLRDLYADKERAERTLRQSPLDWTLVYPTMLTSGPRTGRYRVGERLDLRGLPKISRADVADFLLTQVDDRRYIRKGVLISA